MSYLQDKEKKKENELAEKVASKFEEKLKNIEEDLTVKLNKIIEGLVEIKPLQSQVEPTSK